MNRSSSDFTTLFSGTRSRTPQERSPLAPDAAMEAVRAMNQAYIIAARDNDVAWFRDHMADDVVVVMGSGRRLDKAEFLAMQKNEPRKFRSLIVRNITVRAFGPTVQVDADAPFELADGHRGISRYIDTYAWLDGRWQVISAQVTLLPPTP